MLVALDASIHNVERPIDTQLDLGQGNARDTHSRTAYSLWAQEARHCPVPGGILESSISA